MVLPMRWRFLLTVLVGASAYLGLLQVIWEFFIHSYYPPPQWWRDHLHPRVVSSASWLVLINAVEALLAAVPVALALVFLAKAHRLAPGFLVGVLPGLYITGSGLSEYGRPKYVVTWTVDALQFLSISLAVLLAVVLFSSRPLTTRSSGP